MAYTLLDLAKRNLKDAEFGLLEEAAQLHPELSMGAARTIRGTGYDTYIRTAYGATAFRNANEGTAQVEDTYENRRYETYILNPPWSVDVAVADRSEDGAAALLADKAAGTLESAMQHLASQFYYGVSTDAKGFPGIKAVVNSSMTIDRTGTGAATTEIWAVKFGRQDVQWIYGVDGMLSMSDIETVTKEDDDGNEYQAYQQWLKAYPGLQVGSTYSVGVIKNITTAAKPTSTYIGQLITAFRNKRLVDPDVLLMTPTCLEWYREGLTATTTTGQEAPYPTSIFGVPVVLSHGISEAITAY